MIKGSGKHNNFNWLYTLKPRASKYLKQKLAEVKMLELEPVKLK